MEYGYSAIESFVEFCDDMIIAQEGFEGIKNAIDNLIAAFTSIYEYLHRAILVLKQKMNKDKFIMIPAEYHRKLDAVIEKVNQEWKGFDLALDDDTINRINSIWLNTKNYIGDNRKTLKQRVNDLSKDMVKVPANQLYKQMIESSNMISESIKGIKQLKSKMKNANVEAEIEVYKNAINCYNNKIKLAKIYASIYKTYLSFYKFNENDLSED